MAIKASDMQKYQTRGVKNRYRLVADTFATTVGADGRAKEEGYLPSGTVVSLRGISGDDNPWTGNAQHNRPSGQIPVEVEGHPACELISADTEVELVED